MRHTCLTCITYVSKNRKKQRLNVVKTGITIIKRHYFSKIIIILFVIYLKKCTFVTEKETTG